LIVIISNTLVVSTDPHFRTFDDHQFSYHGQCDLVLARSKSFASGLGLDVHIRTTRVNMPYMDYSYISGAAVKIGDDVLEVDTKGDLFINGEENLSGSAGMVLVGLKGLTKSIKGSGKRIIEYALDLGDSNTIKIRANTKNNLIFVDFDGYFSDTEGLLGGDPREGKSLIARDGITDLSGHWNTYGEEWQVNDSDSKLFQDNERHPQYPEGCLYDAAETKPHYRHRRLLDQVTLESATDACSHVHNEMKEFCIFDTMATGDLNLAEDPFYG
jgi:hypothetical protein